MSLTYYTIKGRNDGFGAQYQSFLSGIAYCNYMKYIYIHSPIEILDHNVDINIANEFIGLNNASINNNNNNIITKCYEPIVHWSKTPSIYYTNDVLKYIRDCYNNAKKPEISSIDIAIHIRRGDVSDKNNKERYTNKRKTKNFSCKSLCSIKDFSRFIITSIF